MVAVAGDNVTTTSSTSSIREVLKNLSTERMREDSQKLLLSKLPSGIVSSSSSSSSRNSSVKIANVNEASATDSRDVSLYDSNFKKKCLDQVIDEYSIFFRVSHYIEDTRSIYLLTMCSMLDAAAAADVGSDESDTTVDSDATSIDPWDLDSLAGNDELFFTDTNWPSVEKNVSIYDQYERLLRVLDRPPTFND